MARVRQTVDLPLPLETLVRPWVIAIETASLGMRELVSDDAAASAGSLKRRVVMEPDLDIAIVKAVVASVVFGNALDQRGVDPAEPRAAAHAALVAVIEKLRTVEPSGDTRALGLGW